MRSAGVLIVFAHLVLAACSLEEPVGSGSAQEVYRGDRVVFSSAADAGVVALFLEEGVYRNYADASDVGGSSDVGGDLEPCGEGIAACVKFAGLYVMAPPSGDAEWKLGSYDFRIVDHRSDKGDHAVIVDRYGEESYSYGYHPECGVVWINFTSGRDNAGEVFHPIGPSLFSTSACASASAS